MTTPTRRKRLLFAAITFVLTALLMIGAVTAADVYAHWRTQDVAGVNVWGYRGAPQSRKPANGLRVVMLGGSTVFGWGLPAHESIPAFLEQRLAAAGSPMSVVNLGAPRQGAYGFLYDLQDFADLDYDIVCLYEGYNDLGGTVPHLSQVLAVSERNYHLWRRTSPVFRAFRYYPILPVVLIEKADILTAPPAGAVAFTPGLAARATASAMRATAAVSAQLSRQLGGLSDVPPVPVVEDDCTATWRHYCGSVRAAVDWARARGKRVLVVTQPYISDSHVDQQANLAAMIEKYFGSDTGVRYLNLGRSIDLRDSRIAYDGLHLVAAGNDTIAAQLVEPVRTLSMVK